MHPIFSLVVYWPPDLLVGLKRLWAVTVLISVHQVVLQLVQFIPAIHPINLALLYSGSAECGANGQGDPTPHSDIAEVICF